MPHFNHHHKMAQKSLEHDKKDKIYHAQINLIPSDFDQKKYFFLVGIVVDCNITKDI